MKLAEENGQFSFDPTQFIKTPTDGNDDDEEKFDDANEIPVPVANKVRTNKQSLQSNLLLFSQQ